MRHLVAGFKLAFSIALLSAGTAFAQTPDEEATSNAAAAPVAYVYVQTTNGINVYDATAAGKLTLVKGSPFKTSGQMEGINGKYLLSVGTTNIRAYGIESNGAVGGQASNINTQNYSGSKCGNTTGNGAVLDHSGKYLYVQLYGNLSGGEDICDAWQAYEIKPNGDLLFLDGVEIPTQSFGGATWLYPTAISSNDKFMLGAYWQYGGYTEESEFTFTAGKLIVNKSKETDPVPNLNDWTGYYPILAAADPASHLAVLVYPIDGVPYGNIGPWQLASYTINDTTGSITSSNTWEKMPYPAFPPLNLQNNFDVSITGLRMSPSGKLLAVAGHPGLQLFHFNGASPITTFSGLLLPAVNVDQLGWDNNNHLYALSYSAEELYVYTVTPTSISEVAGSPFHVANAYGIKGLTVVPK
jgi:hypothetical protein